jgi:glycogen(starch) synthase
MRILMFSWEYPPHIVGGLGKHVAELLPRLGNLPAMDLHLVTPRWNGGLEMDWNGRVTIHRVDPAATSGDLYTAAWQTNLRLEEYARYLWQETGPFDLIHVHDWLVAFVGAAFKNNYKVPLVSTIHATEKGRRQGHLYSDLSRSIHHAEWWLTYESWRVIACSQFMAGEIAGYFTCPRDKIDVIPNGVDWQRFEQPAGEDLRPFRSMYALPDEQIVFCVGRLVYEKGLQVLARALPQVLWQHPTAKVVIAGQGPALDWLRSMAWSLGVGEKVLFTGYVSDEDRDRLLGMADCAVFPSLYEPFGIVALEAMAAHCPVIASDIGGLRDVVQHDETGVTVYPDNPNSLAWGIVYTLQHPDLAAARADRAYRMICDEYTWEHIAERTAGVYQAVIDERAITDW